MGAADMQLQGGSWWTSRTKVVAPERDEAGSASYLITGGTPLYRAYHGHENVEPCSSRRARRWGRVCWVVRAHEKIGDRKKTGIESPTRDAGALGAHDLRTSAASASSSVDSNDLQSTNVGVSGDRDP